MNVKGRDANDRLCTICTNKHGLQYSEMEYEQKFGNAGHHCLQKVHIHHRICHVSSVFQCKINIMHLLVIGRTYENGGYWLEWSVKLMWGNGGIGVVVVVTRDLHGGILFLCQWYTTTFTMLHKNLNSVGGRHNFCHLKCTFGSTQLHSKCWTCQNIIRT